MPVVNECWRCVQIDSSFECSCNELSSKSTEISTLMVVSEVQGFAHNAVSMLEIPGDCAELREKQWRVGGRFTDAEHAGTGSTIC